MSSESQPKICGIFVSRRKQVINLRFRLILISFFFAFELRWERGGVCFDFTLIFYNFQGKLPG
jgi:hypothetical protein